MRELRETGADVTWVFDGVLRALEAEQSIAENAKAVLREMIFAMQDGKKPLPALLPAQQSGRLVAALTGFDQFLDLGLVSRP